MPRADSDEDFGLNEEIDRPHQKTSFNFKDYRFGGKVDLDDIEEPELMEALVASQMGADTGAHALLKSPEKSFGGSQMSDRDLISVHMPGEEDDPFIG